MWDWLADLFPINRSLSGPGTRETIDWIAELLPGLRRHQVASGTKLFDWTVPDEWRLRGSKLVHLPSGQLIVDGSWHTLRTVGYSESVDAVLSLDDLRKHLHFDARRPYAIPYVTSYYKRNWGFCLTKVEFDALDEGPYRVIIDSDLKPGFLDYADFVLPGRSKQEVLVSTYICHPSMANNELSGPVVATALARRLMRDQARYLTYRFVFVPESIGAVAYIHGRLASLRQNVVAGFVLTCCGDDRGFSLMPSRYGTSVVDHIAHDVIGAFSGGTFERASFLQRGSDERQYCSPFVDLPVVSMMRSRYATYPEYHTSDDNLNLVTQRGLECSFEMHLDAFYRLEALSDELEPIVVSNSSLQPGYWRMKFPCEPMLGPRGLYGDLDVNGVKFDGRDLINLSTYADGRLTEEQISKRISRSISDTRVMISVLAKANVIERE